MESNHRASIEGDLERQIRPDTRMRGRVLAGAPLGLVAVLVVASVAFGAGFVRAIVVPAAQPQTTPVVVAGSDASALGGTAGSTSIAGRPSTPEQIGPRTAAATTRPVVVTGDDSGAPTPKPTMTIEPTPAATPASMSTSADPTVSAQPTADPTKAPATEHPAPPSPTSAPVIVELGPLAVADNLDLTLSFAWAPYTAGPFEGYGLFFEKTSSGKLPSYPTSLAWATARATAISMSVAGIPAGDYQVRLQALCGPDTALVVCGQTSVAHVHLSVGRGTSPAPVAPTPTLPPSPTPTDTPAPTLPPTAAPTDRPIVDMGGLSAADNLDMTLSFAWNAYIGVDLTGYAVFAEDAASGRLPTYPTSTAWRTANRSTTSVSVSGIGPGTYNVRVQALCGSGSGLRVCGQTAIARIHLSAARFGSPTPAPAAH